MLYNFYLYCWTFYIKKFSDFDQTYTIYFTYNLKPINAIYIKLNIVKIYQLAYLSYFLKKKLGLLPRINTVKS